MKVAAIQFAPRFKDFEGNVARMEELVLEAATQGAELIVLPELATTGYSFMSPEEARPFAEPVTFNSLDDLNPAKSSVRRMHELASRLEVVIVWGLIELDTGTGEIFNTQVYIEPGVRSQGNQELSSDYIESYRKINPWGNDYLWSGSGEKNPPVITSARLGKRVGLLICRDIRDRKNDDWSNFYSKGDADIVCFSANYGKGGFPAVNWVDFAKENDTNLIVSNRYGEESHNDFGMGGVCVISPAGKVNCAGLIWNQDCIVYSEVP